MGDHWDPGQPVWGVCVFVWGVGGRGKGERSENKTKKDRVAIVMVTKAELRPLRPSQWPREAIVMATDKMRERERDKRQGRKRENEREQNQIKLKSPEERMDG